MIAATGAACMEVRDLVTTGVARKFFRGGGRGRLARGVLGDGSGGGGLQQLFLSTSESYRKKLISSVMFRFFASFSSWRMP